MMKRVSIVAVLLAGALAVWAQTNSHAPSAATVVTNSALTPNDDRTNAVLLAERTEQIRTACVKGRRSICGKVVRILPDGLLVDSGYTALLKSPFNQSWVVSGDATVSREAKTVEVNEPDSACIGLVILTNFPKRPPVKLYDYVAIQGYPVGQQTYTSVPGVQKTVRKFSGGLDTAIKMNLETSQK